MGDATTTTKAGTRTAADEVVLDTGIQPTTPSVSVKKMPSLKRMATFNASTHPRSVFGVITVLLLALVGVAAVAVALGVSQGPAVASHILYEDPVVRCKTELGENSEQCPNPNAEMPTRSQSSPTCDVGIVGAGPGGLYMAMRLVESGTVAANSICVFELTNRAGGRIYSLRGFGRDRNLNVDVGAYRTWPQYTPVTQALIKDKLGLPMGCYDETEDPCEKFNIMNDEGGQLGFVTFVEQMMQKVYADGVRLFPLYKLERIVRTDSAKPATLYFANGHTATITGAVVLNIAQRPLLKIVRASSLPTGVVSVPAISAMHAVQTEVVTKLYLYYRVAWWRYLSLVSGDFSLEGDAQAMPLKGRYHDGDFRCDASKAGQYDACHGFLLAVYSHDYGGEEAIYFRRFQSDRPDPVTIISNATAEGRLFLEHAHARLVEYHKGATNLPPGAAAPYKISEAMDAAWNVAPEFAVLATWNIATDGHGGGWHGWTDLSQKATSMAPLEGADVHVVNEAYSNVQGWAEGSLQHADATLQSRWNIAPPWDFTVPEATQFVAQTKKPACTEEAAATTGGSSSSSSGGGSHICFTSTARLSLANGSSISIAEARVGDRVATGDGGVGVVTEALVHPHHAEFDVAVVSTPHGELVGTPTHPVLVNGTWLELHAAHAAGLLDGVRVEARHVDAFYNLEIDGHKPGQSAHAYVVNGLTVSGLGDHPVLNTRFPRQAVWKAKAGA